MQPVNQIILTENIWSLVNVTIFKISHFSQLRNSTGTVGNMTRITACADQITKLSAEYTHTLIFADIYLLVLNKSRLGKHRQKLTARDRLCYQIETNFQGYFLTSLWCSVPWCRHLCHFLALSPVVLDKWKRWLHLEKCAVSRIRWKLPSCWRDRRPGRKPISSEDFECLPLRMAVGLSPAPRCP